MPGFQGQEMWNGLLLLCICIKKKQLVQIDDNDCFIFSLTEQTYNLIYTSPLRIKKNSMIPLRAACVVWLLEQSGILLCDCIQMTI